MFSISRASSFTTSSSMSVVTDTWLGPAWIRPDTDSCLPLVWGRLRSYLPSAGRRDNSVIWHSADLRAHSPPVRNDRYCFNVLLQNFTTDGDAVKVIKDEFEHGAISFVCNGVWMWRPGIVVKFRLWLGWRLLKGIVIVNVRQTALRYFIMIVGLIKFGLKSHKRTSILKTYFVQLGQ